MRLGETRRQKIQDQLALPGMERGEAPKITGEGIEVSAALHETEEPATEGVTFQIIIDVDYGIKIVRN